MAATTEIETVVPGTPEYEVAMAEKGSQSSFTLYDNNGNIVANNSPNNENPAPTDVPTETPTPDRPSWLPEKFKTVEDMAKAYTELEHKQSGQPTPTDVPTETPDNTPETKPEDLKLPASVNVQELQDEYALKGVLSEASYESLAKAGIDKSIVDMYIAGQEAIAASLASEAHNMVGGKAQYDSIISWALANLSTADKQAFNTSVASNDRSVAALAIKGLEAKFISANGKPPTQLLNGTAPSSTTTGGYESRSQITKAMGDPRYQTDSAYRKEVESRIAMTPQSFF